VAVKKFVRRVDRDYSRNLRLASQLLFLGLNLWIGVQFYLWVRFYETGGQSIEVSRPAGIDGWLPIAALMNLKYLLVTGDVPRMHAAGLFLLCAFLTISFVARKAFCPWLCPIGTISELLWKLGRDTFRRTWRLPTWLDLPLRSLKYVLLGLFAYAIAGMSAAAIDAFLQGPYGVVADVKMLYFFRYLSVGGSVTLGLLVLASIFVQNFWRRYLCPYGALMGIAALLSPVRIRRTAEACIDCGKCDKACPAVLPVSQLVEVRSIECANCMECVAVCPAEKALALTVVNPVKRAVPTWAVALVIASLFTGAYGYARYMGYWNPITSPSVYLELVPRANDFSHP
jgi:polyferredoxin